MLKQSDTTLHAEVKPDSGFKMAAAVFSYIMTFCPFLWIKNAMQYQKLLIILIIQSFLKSVCDEFRQVVFIMINWQIYFTC